MTGMRDNAVERLDKLLANSGVGSRKEVRAIVRSGRVSVNGKPECDEGRHVEPEHDEIILDGVRILGGRRVLMLNKPAGYVTSTQDPRDKTVMELIPSEMMVRGLAPVGRLDKETEGLLLLTNDGELAHQLLSPRYGVEKQYYARHEGTAGPEDQAAFLDGLQLRDGTACRSARLQPLGTGESLVFVHEGKYHQVRRMLAARGLPVIYLERRSVGPITLGNLSRGCVRDLTEKEICDLRNAAGQDAEILNL